MRLDKFLVHTGCGSRKQVKEFIKKKRVIVNDVLITKDDYKIDESKDVVLLDKIRIYYQQFVYIMMNKPKGVISSTDDHSHKTVIDLLKEYHHGVFPVGRLDIDTEGLLLITNDGELSHNLLSPKKHVDKTYLVKLNHAFDKNYIPLIEKGIKINDDEVCKPAVIEIMCDKEILLTITEGKFHQVKRMMHACDNEVVYLKRLKMGMLCLDEKLEIGEYRHLTEDELKILKSE